MGTIEVPDMTPDRAFAAYTRWNAHRRERGEVALAVAMQEVTTAFEQGGVSARGRMTVVTLDLSAIVTDDPAWKDVARECLEALAVNCLEALMLKPDVNFAVASAIFDGHYWPITLSR